jgi:endonuclease/exonuclease/phosphatase (EEP) superfamily protein YafD
MDIKRSLESLSLTAFAIALVLSLPLVAGFFASAHPALDSLAHFRVHLAVVMILFATLALGGSMWRQGLMAIAFGLAAIGTAIGIPAGLGQVHATFHPKDDAAPTYRLLQMNLRFDNAEPGKVLSMIGRTRPDIITLDEVSQMWAQKLDLLSSAYPHRIVCTMENAGGVAILSLRPFGKDQPARCLDGGVFAVADIDLGGRLVQVGALHLHWPWPFDQSAQIDRLAAPLGKMAGTAILAGDLNATPWSASARRVAEAGAFHRVKVPGPTWLYRRLPEALRFAGLPIDHIFAKGDVMVHSARTLEAAGSDHLPLLMEFSLKPAPETPGGTSQPATVVQSPAGIPAG